MANTLLTPDMILREAGRIFHQKALFIGSIDRQYDSSFAKTGAKIGESLRLRDPNQYTVTNGPTMAVQDTPETSKTLTINKHKHVAMNFGMQEMALSLDDFSKRILEPAMAVLAANVEADALSTMTKDIHNIIDGDGAAFDFIHLANAQAKLNDTLTPPSERTCLLSNSHVAKFLNANKGQFNPQGAISKQWKEGIMGNTCGMDIGSSSLVSDHTTGTAVKATGYLTNSATAQTGASIIVDTGSTTFKQGDVITIAGVNRVHPETKVSTGALQQFVLTADYAGGAGTITISPAIVATGAKQNCSNGAADNQAITKVGAAASELLNGSLAFHKEAFVFASADLPDPSEFGAWGARRTVDGIRFSIAKQFDILNYKIPCRLDIIYGYKTRYPESAVRIHADG
jgi:hypothetical protein